MPPPSPTCSTSRRRWHPGAGCRGRRIAVLTSTGGAATLVADSAGLAGFETPPPDEATAERLRALDIRDAVLDRNPIDVTLAGLRPDLFRSAIGTLLQSPTYDAVTVIIGSSGLGQPDLVAGPVTEALGQSDKPLLVFVSPEAPGILRHLNRNGVPAFAAPELCCGLLGDVDVGAGADQDRAETEPAAGPART